MESSLQSQKEPVAPSVVPPPKKSKFLVAALTGILCLIVALGVFQLGLMVGYNKARFACGISDRYDMMIGVPRAGRGSAMMPPPGGFDPHTAAGSVISLQGTDMVIKGKDGEEKSIVILPSTEFREGTKTIQSGDVTATDRVVIFGSPNTQGQVEAQLIRVFDHRLIP